MKSTSVIKWQTFRLLFGLCCLLLAASACSSGSSGQETETTKTTSLVIGEQTIVNDGDRLVNTSTPPAVLNIEHDLFADRRYVTLLEGSADLFRE